MNNKNDFPLIFMLKSSLRFKEKGTERKIKKSLGHKVVILFDNTWSLSDLVLVSTDRMFFTLFMQCAPKTCNNFPWEHAPYFS